MKLSEIKGLYAEVDGIPIIGKGNPSKFGECFYIKGNRLVEVKYDKLMNLKLKKLPPVIIYRNFNPLARAVPEQKLFDWVMRWSLYNSTNETTESRPEAEGYKLVETIFGDRYKNHKLITFPTNKMWSCNYISIDLLDTTNHNILLKDLDSNIEKEIKGIGGLFDTIGEKELNLFNENVNGYILHSL